MSNDRYFDIAFPVTIVHRVTIDDLADYDDDGRMAIDNCLLAYIADMIDRTSNLTTKAHDIDANWSEITVGEYQKPPYPALRALLGKERTVICRAKKGMRGITATFEVTNG